MLANQMAGLFVEARMHQVAVFLVGKELKAGVVRFGLHEEPQDSKTNTTSGCKFDCKTQLRQMY